MKKTFMTLAVGAICGVCPAQNRLSVELSDLANDTVYMIVLDKNMRGLEKTDTIIAKDGAFTYDYAGEKARRALIRITARDGRRQLSAWLVPGENGTLAGTATGATWSGSSFYNDLGRITEASKSTRTEMDKISGEFRKRLEAGEKQESVAAELSPKYDALEKKLKDASMDYVKQHPASPLSVLQAMETGDAEAALALVTPDTKSGVMSDIVDLVSESIARERVRKEAAKGVSEGCMAPDFTLKDIDGKDLSLSSLRGKYVVLDFWGSWCGWCIKGFPEMKNYYAKYAGKFEILGVDCNDTEDKWKAAVAKNKLPWKHVYNPRTSDLTSKYAIEGFPTKLVIDPEGKIVKTAVGEGPSFYQYLDSLFGAE